YFEHFLYIAHGMRNMAGAGIDLWDEQDQFFCDVVHLPSGQNIQLKIHSMVGLVPLMAVLAPRPAVVAGLESFREGMRCCVQHRQGRATNGGPWTLPGHGETALLASLHGDRLTAVLRRLLSNEEFLSDYGVRALSRYHLEHPYVFSVDGQEFTVKY